MSSLKNIRMYRRTVGMAGILSAVASRISGATRYCEVALPGYKHPFRLRVPSSDVYTYEQIFDNLEYDFSVEKPPQVIIDAGANIGLASIYFANKYPGARILAIEPERSNFELLKENVRPYPQVTPIHAALWNKNEEINLTDPGLGNWGFITEDRKVSEAHASKSVHTVMALTVDDLLHDYGLERIDILKIDIEGAEKEVFSNSSSWLAKVDAIIIELHERTKPGCTRSFYCGSNGFTREWQQGENVYLSRGGLAPLTGS
jgi:FkbM family methyltransferase